MFRLTPNGNIQMGWNAMSGRKRWVALGLLMAIFLMIVSLIIKDAFRTRDQMTVRFPVAHRQATQFLDDLYPGVPFRLVCDYSAPVDSPRWRIVCTAVSGTSYPPMTLYCPFLATDIRNGSRCVLR